MNVFIGDEFNAQDDETEETAEGNLHTPLENQTTNLPDGTNTEEIPGEEGAPLLSMVTRSRKRKFLDYDSITSSCSSPVSELSKNFEDNPDLGIEIAAEKRRNLDNDVIQDSVVRNSGLCDVIVRDVIYDVVRAVVDDVICDIVDDAISKVSVSESADVVINGVDSEGLTETTETPNGNEGHSDETIGVNGLDPIRTSVNDKEQQLMETESKNTDREDNRDTAMDIDGFDRQNHGTLMDNGSPSMTNGNEHDEQNVDTRDIEHTLPEESSGYENKHKSSMMISSVQNCSGTQEINGRECYRELTGILPPGNEPTTIPTGKEPTRLMPTVKEPTRINPTEKEHTQMVSTGMTPTGNESA